MLLSYRARCEMLRKGWDQVKVAMLNHNKHTHVDYRLGSHRDSFM